jgi:hypothetical protein
VSDSAIASLVWVRNDDCVENGFIIIVPGFGIDGGFMHVVPTVAIPDFGRRSFCFPLCMWSRVVTGVVLVENNVVGHGYPRVCEHDVVARSLVA